MSRWQWVFAIAAAIVGAATVDPLVEHLSNIGLFGAGSFTDRTTADVLPALCAGAFFSIAFVILAVVRELGFSDRLSRWFEQPVRELDELGLRALLGRIYLIQIFVLFAMESAEQRIVLGHFLGGMIWLGGPVAVSLALHFAGCVVTSFLLSRALALLAQRVVAVVRSLLSSFVKFGSKRTQSTRPRGPELVRIFAPLLDRPIVRPPPLRPA